MLPPTLPTLMTMPDGAASPAHAGALKRHLRHCRQASGPWFMAASWAERAHSQLAPRFITTIATAAVVLALLSSWG